MTSADVLPLFVLGNEDSIAVARKSRSRIFATGVNLCALVEWTVARI